jgi:hypothetical protein
MDKRGAALKTERSDRLSFLRYSKALKQSNYNYSEKLCGLVAQRLAKHVPEEDSSVMGANLMQ